MIDVRWFPPASFNSRHLIMPIHVDFSPDFHHASFELIGDLAYADLHEVMLELIERPDLERLQTKVIDLRGLEWLAAERHQFVELSAMESEIAGRAPRVAVAIVVASDYGRGIATMWASLINQTKFVVRIFDADQESRDDVVLWLEETKPRR